VANAVFNALGVRIDEIPITPDRVLRALADRAKGGPGRVGPAQVPHFDFPPLVRAEIPPEWADGQSRAAAELGEAGSEIGPL
jgi:hypothetical protein